MVHAASIISTFSSIPQKSRRILQNPRREKIHPVVFFREKFWREGRTRVRAPTRGQSPELALLCESNLTALTPRASDHPSRPRRSPLTTPRQSVRWRQSRRDTLLEGVGVTKHFLFLPAPPVRPMSHFKFHPSLGCPEAFIFG